MDNKRKINYILPLISLILSGCGAQQTAKDITSILAIPAYMTTTSEKIAEDINNSYDILIKTHETKN